MLASKAPGVDFLRKRRALIIELPFLVENAGSDTKMKGELIC